MLDVEALSEMMAGVIAEEVGKAIAPLHAKIAELESREPIAGEPGEKGDPGEAGESGRDGADGKDGKDGRGVKDLLIDREGQLIATMEDGEMKSLGVIIGKDGEAGKDGRDGLGFDDMDVCVLDDDRTIELAFRRGEEEKAFTLKWPTIIDRGVFKPEQEYEPGDGVTWGGQFYIANEKTNMKPDASKDGKPWRLAIRKGRDGKDLSKNG